MEATPTPKRTRKSVMYHWKPTNQDFTSQIALLNFLVEKKVLELTARTFICRYCGKDLKSTIGISIHYFSAHNDKVSLK